MHSDNLHEGYNDKTQTVGAFAFIAAAALPARAQTTGAYLLTQGTPITVHGWTITLDPTGTGASTCSASGTGSCATSEVIPTVSNTSLGITLSLVFVSSSDSTFQSSTVSPGSDVSIGTVLVTAPSGLQIYDSQVNMSYSTTAPLHVSVTDTITDGGTVLAGLTTNGYSTPTLQGETFTPNNTVTGNVDFRSGTGTAATTMNSATLTFTAAPEPISSSLFAVGIAGLGFIKRRTRRTS